MGTTIDDTDTNSPASVIVNVTLKWAKQVLNFDINIPTPSATTADGTESRFTGKSFKDIVYSLTKVPVERQKVVVTKSKSKSKSKSSTETWWNSILKDDFDFSSALAREDDTESGTEQEPIELSVTVMGTAEVLESQNDQRKTKFLEDMTPAEKEAEDLREFVASLENVAAMIPALQIPPQHRQPFIRDTSPDDKNDEDDGEDVKDDGDRKPASIDTSSDDKKVDDEETRAYDRLVHGLSQLKIDALLEHQVMTQNSSPSGSLRPPRLLGRVVMTMGLELQRAYVNDLAVLSEDGTLVSGLDNGHVQMWKHCQRVSDLVHQSAGGFGGFGAFSGVDSVLGLNNNNQGPSPVAFATAGKGCIRVWDSEGEHVLGRTSPLPFASPTGLVQIPTSSNTNFDNNVMCLAARFRIARPPSRRSRLVPQDNAGRGRVAEIETSENLMNEKLMRLSESVQILFASSIVSSTTDDSNSGIANPIFRSTFLKSPSTVTAMTSWDDGNERFLAVGDDHGGILFWKIGQEGTSSHSSHAPRLTYTKLRYLWIASVDNPAESRSSVVCIKYVTQTKQLFISTQKRRPTKMASTPAAREALTGVTVNCFPLKPSQAVHCIKLDAILKSSNVDPLVYTLNGHKDAVYCVLPLPNGDLVTAGGKLDATTQVWSRAQLREAEGGDDVWLDNMEMQKKRLSSLPPPILRLAATPNLCKDAGYVFAATLLKDYKNQSDSDGASSSKLKSTSDASNPFAIAVARYNVVKIVL